MHKYYTKLFNMTIMTSFRITFPLNNYYIPNMKINGRKCIVSLM